MIGKYRQTPPWTPSSGREQAAVPEWAGQFCSTGRAGAGAAERGERWGGNWGFGELRRGRCVSGEVQRSDGYGSPFSHSLYRDCSLLCFCELLPSPQAGWISPCSSEQESGLVTIAVSRSPWTLIDFLLQQKTMKCHSKIHSYGPMPSAQAALAGCRAEGTTEHGEKVLGSLAFCLCHQAQEERQVGTVLVCHHPGWLWLLFAEGAWACQQRGAVQVGSKCPKPASISASMQKATSFQASSWLLHANS